MSTDTYRDLVARLGERTAEQVTAIHRSYLDGDLDHDEAVGLIATFVTAANERATVLADLGLAATLTVALGAAVRPLGLRRPPGDLQRLTKAAGTLLAIKDVTADRVARLGRSEPLTAAQEARGQGLARSTLVEGWTRAVSGSGCELCTWWAREGRVWRPDHPMPTHPGCTCSQTPVVTTTDNYQTEHQKTGAAESRARRERNAS
jgi:hypothetical protein